MKLADWCWDMIKIFSRSVYLIIIVIGYCITISHITALYLLRVWVLISRYNFLMPSKGSYLNLIISSCTV